MNSISTNLFKSNCALFKSRSKLKRNNNINIHQNLSLNSKYKTNLQNNKFLLPKKLLFSLHKNLNKTENNLSYKNKNNNILNPSKNSEPEKICTKFINYSNHAKINKTKNCYLDYERIQSILNNEDHNTNNSLYKNFYIGYNKNGEFIDNEKIKEFRKNLRLFSSINSRIYTSNLKDSKINKDKGTLLSYNFNRDAYSNEQRLLYKNSDSNLKFEINDIKSGLKKQKTTINNYKVIASPNNYKKNTFYKNNKRYKIFKNRIISKNIKNNMISLNEDKLNLNKDIKGININNNNNETPKEKIIDKKEKLTLINEPKNIINYIYSQIKEFKARQLLLKSNKRKFIRAKLENFKSDLKQLEKEAFFQLINLKYERPPGKEINIKTSLFCSK